MSSPLLQYKDTSYRLMMFFTIVLFAISLSSHLLTLEVTYDSALLEKIFTLAIASSSICVILSIISVPYMTTKVCGHDISHCSNLIFAVLSSVLFFVPLLVPIFMLFVFPEPLKNRTQKAMNSASEIPDSMGYANLTSVYTFFTWCIFSYWAFVIFISTIYS